MNIEEWLEKPITISRGWFAFILIICFCSLAHINPLNYVFGKVIGGFVLVAFLLLEWRRQIREGLTDLSITGVLAVCIVAGIAIYSFLG